MWDVKELEEEFGPEVWTSEDQDFIQLACRTHGVFATFSTRGPSKGDLTRAVDVHLCCYHCGDA